MIHQNLNKKQQEAVDYFGGPILIAAGAGSGKTRTLTNRLARILSSGVSPESVIAITFTNKAAEEMRNRIFNHQIPDTKYQIPFIGTFHSLGARILKKEAGLLKRGANFSIFDGDDSLRLIKSIVKNFNFSGENKRNANPLFLRKEFSRIKNELKNSDNKEEIIKILFDEYEKALCKNNAFDFDDLIEKPVRIFSRHPLILEKYQNRFRHILVDEFQDTNMAQYAFIKSLAQKYRNLSVVGDDQQSIYKFRGSDFRNFLNFENDWPNAKIVLLEQNYRSSGNIIGASSEMIANNKFQKPKKLWTENSGGEPIKIIEHSDETAEAEYISGMISDKNKSIAILYRTNAQSRAIESALIEKGINYSVFGGLKFYERKEIKDILAALRWGFNQNDSVSLERLKKNFLKKPFLTLKEKIPEIISEAKAKPTELIGYVLEAGDYFNYLKKNYLNAEERIENINELIHYAVGFNDLAEFLERVSLLQANDAIKTGKKPFVNLMTIHLAKGLEFDRVFIVGCNEGLLPHQMSYSDDLEIEEERRLMYVAMTRARKELYLNFYNLPSRFLSEIPTEFCEFAGERDLEDEERYITVD